MSVWLNFTLIIRLSSPRRVSVQDQLITCPQCVPQCVSSVFPVCSWVLRAAGLCGFTTTASFYLTLTWFYCSFQSLLGAETSTTSAKKLRAASCGLQRLSGTPSEHEDGRWVFVVCSDSCFLLLGGLWSENLLRRLSLCSAGSSSVSAAGKQLLSGHKDSQRHSELPSKPSGPSSLLMWTERYQIYWRGHVSPSGRLWPHRRGQVIRCVSYLDCQRTKTVQEFVGRPGNVSDGLGVGPHVTLRDAKRQNQF